MKGNRDSSHEAKSPGPAEVSVFIFSILRKQLLKLLLVVSRLERQIEILIYKHLLTQVLELMKKVNQFINKTQNILFHLQAEKTKKYIFLGLELMNLL